MRFYTGSHAHYCGIDLHAKTMYLCILDREGQVLLHENLRSRPEAFLEAVAPYREDLVVAVECIFTWYWLADLCRREGIRFFLGHALYMKAIHGGKAKNDRLDAGEVRAQLGGQAPGERRAKVGNVHLKWAFSEAAVLFLRQNPRGQEHLRRLAGKHGKSKALSILGAKLGRAVYHLLRRERTFDPERFFAMS